MLSKIIVYSLAAIALGVAIMLLPLYVILFFPVSYQKLVSEGPTLTEAVKPTEDITRKISASNATRDLSTLSEAAQFYGRADITSADTTKGDKISDGSLLDSASNILIPTVMVALAGLLAALLVKLVSGSFFKAGSH